MASTTETSEETTDSNDKVTALGYVFVSNQPELSTIGNPQAPIPVPSAVALHFALLTILLAASFVASDVKVVTFSVGCFRFAPRGRMLQPMGRPVQPSRLFS